MSESATFGTDPSRKAFRQNKNQERHVGRFFFHLHHCGTFIEDPEGRNFRGLDQAIDQAKREARDLLAAEVAQGKLCLGCRIEVVEESTGRAFIVPFSATVQVESGIAEKPPAL